MPQVAVLHLPPRLLFVVPHLHSQATHLGQVPHQAARQVVPGIVDDADDLWRIHVPEEEAEHDHEQ